ncbi:zinc ABC transporter substrate-binding protein [Paeniglutamicibacter sp. ABSL32-1]|uniref:metal ABC transporter solute-binding protein, Zn/Mn family n=1 Tax=Paeniglutamicibacter quisquiliarum TaxID=2849498 RepID=UPI001C2DAFDA|nr:zinc ABC transporter substrate-binding protein [Paeniglutamicibacter quisquiliarum]MBV1780535.1 zinc ABC transporter substrate-binding protein [Paeniglutamicibacter quisquiliarum]
MNRRTLRLVPLALAGTLALAACGGNAASQESVPAGQDRLQVVTSTTVYADLVSRIGGDEVEATPVINSVSQDPHSYEATSRDKLALSKAQLVVANGGGYDAFMDVLAKDLKLSDATLVNAVDTSPIAEGEEGAADEHADEATAHDEHAGETAEEHAAHDEHADETAEEHAAHDEHADETAEAEGHEGHAHGAFNEHIWYDLESMRMLTDEIAKRLGTLKPESAAVFTENAAALTSDLKGLEARVEKLHGALDGKKFAMTEPVPFHLLTDMGMVDATPEGLSESIEGGGEVSPQAFNEMGKRFEAGDIDVLAYNTQTESPQTERIRKQAEGAKVPVVDFTETLPENTDFVSWMGSNIQAMESVAK